MNFYNNIAQIAKKEKKQLEKMFGSRYSYQSSEFDEVDQNINWLISTLVSRMIVHSGKIPYMKKYDSDEMRKMALNSEEIKKYIIFISLFRIYVKTNLSLREPIRDTKNENSMETAKILLQVFGDESQQFKIFLKEATPIADKILKSEDSLVKISVSLMNMLLVNYIESEGVMTEKIKKDIKNSKGLNTPEPTFEKCFNFVADAFYKLSI